jgi:ATP synthase protein I
MTTTTRTGSGRTAPRVLAVSTAVVVVAVLVLAGVAVVVTGAPAAAGALVGGGIAASFFTLGSSVVSAATRLAPQTALVVALLTYALQVALVALVFAALVSSGALEGTLSRGWLAGGVTVATVAWTAAQMIATARARVPAYDLPGDAARAHSGSVHGPVSGSSKAGAA